jgi:hypothetical protein
MGSSAAYAKRWVHRTNTQRLAESSRVAVRPPGGWGRRAPAKPAIRVNPYPETPSYKENGGTEKTGQSSDHRPRCATFRNPRTSYPCGAIRQYLRTVSRADRVGTGSCPECHGHLARPGSRSRFPGRLSDREKHRWASETAGIRNAERYHRGSGRPNPSLVRGLGSSSIKSRPS